MFLEVYPQVLGVSTLKRCSKCGEYKPLDDFHRDKGSKSGRTSECKICACLRTREWTDANRDRKHETDKVYREINREHRLAVKRMHYQNNKKRHQEQGAVWYRANRNGVIDRSRRYAAEHHDERLEYARQYRLTEQGKALETANRQKRRARKYAAKGTHSKDDLIAIRAAQTDKRGRLICWRCGKPITDTPDLDHWIPLDKEGSNSAGNLHYMHATCNRSKGAKHPTEIGRLL